MLRRRTGLYIILIILNITIFYLFKNNNKPKLSTDAVADNILKPATKQISVQNNYGKKYNSSNQCIPNHPNRFMDFVKERTPKWKLTTPKLEKEINERLFQFINDISDKPIPNYRGTGIVMTVYSNVADMALGSLTFLYRELKSKLDCEIFYEFLSDHYIQKYKELGCKVKQFNNDKLLYNPPVKRTDTNTYWKIIAILESEFEHVLFLDCDNIPLREPSFLFESKEYKETGMILWPDFWTLTGENPLWRILGLECINEKEHESGQVVVQKSRLFHQLQVSLYLSMSPDFTIYTHGDKETFSLAMRLYNTPYHKIKQNTFVIGTDLNGFCGMGMLQFYNDPIFMHINFLKYSRKKRFVLDRALEMKDESILQIGGCLTAKNGGRTIEVEKEWGYFNHKLVEAYIDI